MRTVSGYENQILIGHIWERNVVRKKAAVCGEERCVTSLKTAAKETSYNKTLDNCTFGLPRPFLALEPLLEPSLDRDPDKSLED